MKSIESFPTIHFLIPDPWTFVSGGNIYNKSLIDALKANNCTIKLMDLSMLKKAVSDSNEKKLLIVDTLYLKSAVPILTGSKSWYSVLLVHHLESMYPPDGKTHSEYFDQYERDLLQHFNAFWVTSHFTRQFLLDQSVFSKIMVVPPALQKTIQQFPVRSTAPLKAIMVANLVKRKGLLPFLKSLAKVDPAIYKGQLSIQLFGTDQIDVNYAMACQSFLEENPFLKQCFRYQGTRSSAELDSEYQQANLLISTAFMESFGMALQEAVAHQLPILALAGGNVSHHIQQGQNGYLCENFTDLVQQLIHLVQTPASVNALLDGAKLYRPYQEYHWADAAKQFQEQFLDICKDYYYI